MANVKRNVRKAFRALKRAGLHTRLAKAGANNVGKASVKANQKGKRRGRGRRGRRSRRY